MQFLAAHPVLSAGDCQGLIVFPVLERPPVIVNRI
jgi:hypothetical protein